jgi:hypothetical protein
MIETIKKEIRMNIEEVKKVNLDAEECNMLDIVNQIEKEFEEEVLSGYSSMMTGIYRKYTNLTQEHIRLKVLSIISNHVIKRIDDALKSKDKKLEKLKQIKAIVKE